VLIVWAWAAALLVSRVSWITFAVAVALMTVAAGANFLVFLLGAFPDQWINYSVILFGAAWALSGWLLVRSLRTARG
jgi:hypothetical protein